VLYKAAHHFLKCFQRSTIINERQLEVRYRGELQLLRDRVIPMMEEHGILARRQWQGRGRPQGVWSLQYRLEDVIAAEDGSNIAGLESFWIELRDAAKAETVGT
jgi:hypothetical protein